MIKHIVCFKLKDPTETAVARAKEVLLSMIGNVPMMKSIEVGLDLLHSDRSCDICLTVTLDDRAALQAYADDPYHCNVVKTHMRAVCCQTVTADYEF